MREAEELEKYLGEISKATSPMNLQHILSNAHHQNQSSHVDHAYGHASCVTQGMNGMYGGGDDDDGGGGYECLKHTYACASSPLSGFSSRSHGSSSSLFSGGGSRSFSDIGPPSPPQFEDLKPHWVSGDGLCWDFKRASDSNLIDYYNLSRDFSKMNIGVEQEGVSPFPFGNRHYDQSPNGAGQRRGFSDSGGFNVSLRRNPVKFEEVSPAVVEMQHHPRMANLLGQRYLPTQSDRLFSRSEFRSSAIGPQLCGDNVVSNNNSPMGFVVPHVSSSLDNPSLSDNLFYPSRKRMDLFKARDSFYAPNMVQLPQLLPHYDQENIIHYQPPMPNERIKMPLCARMPQGSVESFTREDGLIVRGEGISYGMNKNARQRGHSRKSLQHEIGAGKSKEKRSSHLLDHAAVQDSCRSPMMYCPSLLPRSLSEARGNIYHMAKDQQGCRFLQRMFEEGTALDVLIIFEEIVDQVVELMMNPFGNYLMQKLLEVCNDAQRMRILQTVTKEPGELVRISLNTHGYVHTYVLPLSYYSAGLFKQFILFVSALEWSRSWLRQLKKSGRFS